MSEAKALMKVEANMVVTMAFTLTVDGEIIENTDDSEPIQFIQGRGQVLPALEKHLYGMSVGDHKEITLQPSEAYGEYDAEDYSDIPRENFPPQIPIRAGVELQIKDENGENHYAIIQSFDDNHVRVNFNHPLAGKELLFSIRITALRHATRAELEDGLMH